uniref:calmodulin-like protein 10 n=1 Tax=Styela clava TaxID=7725 RepID=UPI0019399AB3|nr:calmodulin-like protein 10 [Styela clava]
MGNLMSYPLQPEIISYHRPQDYNSFGERKNIPKEENVIEKLHYAHLEEVFASRQNSNTRRKLLDVSDEEYAKKFPQWSPAEISNFKAQFLIFDSNRDGILDFIEMNSVLDEFGESSKPNERWRCFNSMDIDHSGTVDFEEFLIVISRLQRADKKDPVEENILNIVTRGARQVAKLRNMSVSQQIADGLF